MFAKLKKFLHWGNNPKPDISLAGELYEQLKPFRLPLILVQFFLLFGTLGYLILEDYDLMQAFFQTSYTFTNTGFGSLGEKDFGTITILFTAILMVCGAGVVTFSVAFIMSVVNNGTLIRLIKEQKMVYKIARLQNHYVICYHNEFTIELAQQFLEAHIPFVVVDNSKDFEAQAQKHKYPYYIIDDPHTHIAMLKSHLSSAKGIVSFSKNAADNITMVVSARLFEEELGRKPYYIIASANSQEESKKLKKLGCDSVISASKLMAQRISAMAVRPDMENLLEQFLYRRDTPLDLEEIIVPRYSWLVLKKLKEAHFRDVTNVSVVGLTQKDGTYISMPNGNTIVSSECKLLVIGSSENIRATKRLIMRKQKPREVDYV
ncbi:potassium channel protein [Helicobacter cinaedi PAGU611]|uniref:Potassium channel protein n=1 Tax=Helicobacter cinaedi CCUG 18818 = ATCC BAA-847 TaxID=537971 RepID=A0AAI8QI08_9HELI|nr:potassium channel family protein [Helicobacter cinaedi]AWK62428.1 potassium channel protein [Helicobacter cinaedi]EFR45965.1 TrkA N-terminal domain protein [Helicobacter cinaedi CCUG 18818 = ATCC BAA-847]QOQ90777.1 potassium channel protein [Helicobacter cinaedi]QOQ96936.1 potassium channel protein [Helicobacter cinaedi]BAM12994.1 potassium channel protein [Helicobacter cinaedi PAGU611]